MADNIEQQQNLAKKAFASEQGRIALGQAMAEPINSRMNRFGLCRNILVVISRNSEMPLNCNKSIVVIPAGYTAPTVHAFVVNETIPEFELVVNPSSTRRDIEALGHLKTCVSFQEGAADDLVEQEDQHFLDAVNFSAEKFGTQFVVNSVVDGFTSLSSQINPRMIKFAMNSADFDVLIAKHKNIKLIAECFGEYEGRYILASDRIQKGKLYGFGSNIGVLKHQQEIEAIPADGPKDEIGYVISEIINLAIFNPEAVAVAMVKES